MANLKNTVINNTASLKLPVGSTSQRPSALSQAQLRFNNDTQIIEQYEGNKWFSDFKSTANATGGSITTITEDGIDYRVHTFSQTGTSVFEVTRGGPFEYLIVAGGGAGGDTDAGGGGAGGVLQGSVYLSPGDYNVVVGDGAPRNTNNDTRGQNGENSSFAGKTAVGGGGGGAAFDRVPNESTGGDGGSSGAGGTDESSPGEYIPGQGHPGGTGQDRVNGGGGGGGAGSPGENGPRGFGGIGIVSSINGTATVYGDGGGGGHSEEISSVQGGSGRGGSGAASGGGSDAEPNSGSGGGGGGGSLGDGGAGGSGIVIIRYRI